MLSQPYCTIAGTLLGEIFAPARAGKLITLVPYSSRGEQWIALLGSREPNVIISPARWGNNNGSVLLAAAIKVTATRRRKKKNKKEKRNCFSTERAGIPEALLPVGQKFGPRNFFFLQLFHCSQLLVVEPKIPRAADSSGEEVIISMVSVFWRNYFPQRPHWTSVGITS